MRDGGVQEWYVNGADGLEHGFTLDQPPGVRLAGVPLRLALQVNEGWRAVADEDGQRVTLRGAGGEAVEYGKLVVRDHLGRNIPARMVADEQVIIEVEDHEAAYPLTIDPLFALQQRLLAADRGGGGYSVRGGARRQHRAGRRALRRCHASRPGIGLCFRAPGRDVDAAGTIDR